MRVSLNLVAAACLLLGGCSSSNLTDLVGQLSKDPATSCMDLQITTPWGITKATYARSNSAAGSSASDANGGCAFNHNGGGVAPVAPPLAPTSPSGAPAVSAVPLQAPAKPISGNSSEVWKPDLVNLMVQH